MAKFTDEEVKKIIEQAQATASKPQRPETPVNDPLDDPNNMDVPRGGRWGIPGAGMSNAQFRVRFGFPGLGDTLGGKIKAPEVKQKVDRTKQVQPDEIVAYSRGAPVYNMMRQDPEMPADIPVTYVAPSSYRNYGSAPVPPTASGSKVMIGDRDRVVPLKQAAKTAVNADAPLYVLPGLSHLGIMYSKGNVTPDTFELDAEEVVNDPEMPDWGKSGGGTEEDVAKQKELSKLHVKHEAYIRDFVKSVIGGK